jgi:hypothetical protein
MTRTRRAVMLGFGGGEGLEDRKCSMGHSSYGGPSRSKQVQTRASDRRGDNLTGGKLRGEATSPALSPM